MEATAFSLIVIRTAGIEASLAFYTALGLNFIQEQHGSGPIHYSCDLGGIVMEIYPASGSGSAPEPRSAGATMLGFKVASLTDTLAELKALGYEPKTAPKEAEWGLWVNIADPDGRLVQLNQPVD